MSERLSQRDFLRLTGAAAASGPVPRGVLAARNESSKLATDKAPGDPAHFSELWGEREERRDPCGQLPDFSYACYHMGEKPIPDVPVRANGASAWKGRRRASTRR